jgi:Spy/CpxP family protein refolding chaperone
MKIKMKKFLFMVLFLSAGFYSSAQDKDDHREKIKALKTAYITEGLNLTAQEAQQFWPIYNEYEKKRRELYRQERAEVNVECLSEEKADSKLEEYVELERKDYLLKKEYYKDLKKIFTARRIMELNKVENDFNRKMMREYRARQASNE